MNEENTPFTPPENPNPPYPPFPPGNDRYRQDAPFWPNRAPRRSSFWRRVGKFFAWTGTFFLAALGAILLLGMIGILFSLKGLSTDEESKNKPVEKILAGSEISPKKIVVLPIEGMITENEFGFVRNCIQAAYDNDRLSGLILRVNSPGGTIAGSDYYYTLLSDLKKERKVPVYVSMGGVAASGGYYVSTVADKIFAERSTITGSIGVISMMMDASALCDKLGVRTNNIVSGKNKGMGDFTRPMSDEERAIWQGLIDEAYDQFLSVVREGRPAFAPKTEGESDADSADPLREIADGRVYSAAEAKRLGLIDEIGFLKDAAEAMIRDELKAADDDVEIVRYKKQENVLSVLGAETDGKAAVRRAASLVETLSTPNLYYMVPGTLPSFD